MEKKINNAKPNKKGFWTMLKESITKANSGCGPGCGCHVENQDNDKQNKSNTTDKPMNNKE